MNDVIQIDTIVNTGGSEKSLDSLKQSVDTLTKDLSKLTIGSDAYNKKLVELKNATTQYTSAQNQVKSATISVNEAMGMGASIIGGLGGAMNAYRAIAGATGDTNSELVQSMAKIQAGMALVQSMGALAGALKNAQVAFKALNVAMAANPIMIVVAAVAALVAGIGILVGSFSKEIDYIGRTNAALDAHKRALDDARAAVNRRVKEMQFEGKTETEILKYRREELNKYIEASVKEENAIKDRIATMKRLGKSTSDIEEVTKALQEQVDATNKLRKEYSELSFEIDLTSRKEAQKLDEEAAATKERQNAEYQRELDALNKAKQALSEYNKEKEYEALSTEDKLVYMQNELDTYDSLIQKQSEHLKTAKDYEAYTQLLKDRDAALQSINAIQSEINANAAEQANNAQAEVDAENERLLIMYQKEEALQNLKDSLSNFDEELNMNEDELAQKRLDTLQQQLDGIATLMQAEGLSIDEKINLQTKYNQAYMKLADERKKRDTKDDNDKKKRQELMANTSIDAASTALSAIGELTKDNAKAQKAIDIGQAAISATKSVMAAMTLPPPASYVAAAVNAAAGIANIATIIKTDVGDGGGGAMPSIANSVPEVPELENTVIETHNNQDAYDREVMNQDTRVYLVESDLDIANNKRVNIENKTSF